MKLPETGIEPVRVLPRRILSPVRLPIPPLGLTFFCVVSAAQLIYQNKNHLSTTFFTFFKKFKSLLKPLINQGFSPLISVLTSVFLNFLKTNFWLAKALPFSIKQFLSIRPSSAMQLRIKKDKLYVCPHLLGGEGFEPSKLSQQIYSLPPLAARESTHMQLESSVNSQNRIVY